MDFIYTSQIEEYEDTFEPQNSEDFYDKPAVTQRPCGNPAELSKYAFLHNEFFD